MTGGLRSFAAAAVAVAARVMRALFIVFRLSIWGALDRDVRVAE